MCRVMPQYIKELYCVCWVIINCNNQLHFFFPLSHIQKTPALCSKLFFRIKKNFFHDSSWNTQMGNEIVTLNLSETIKCLKKFVFFPSFSFHSVSFSFFPLPFPAWNCLVCYICYISWNNFPNVSKRYRRREQSKKKNVLCKKIYPFSQFFFLSFLPCVFHEFFSPPLK